VTARRKQIELLTTWLLAVLVISVVSVGVVPTIADSPVGAQALGPAPSVDLDNLDPVPERTWGVSGLDSPATQTPSIDVLVWDMVQIGDRMFVAGGFLDVQESKYSTPIPQPFLAAFDARSGDWIDSFRPQLDRIVYSLADLNGTLLVGGEFEQVNGQARTGLVGLDPITGAIDPTFAGYVERPWSNLRAMVRDIKVHGDNIYVAGNFSHLNGAWGVRTRVYKAARLVGQNGAVDAGWKPQVTGSGIWGLDTNPSETEVYFTGYFTAVNGEAETGYFHTVDTVTGATAPGKIEVPRNYPALQPEFFDVAHGDNNVFVAGEQHILQILNESDQAMTGYHHAGGLNDGFEWIGGFAGGAYQVAERLGDLVFAGCHCPYSVRNGNINHYSSGTGQRTTHRLFMAYDAATGLVREDFEADLHSPQDGAWSFAADSYGCLWAGGDYHVGGVDHGAPRWVGGFARFCPTDFDPDAPPPPDPDPNALIEAGSSWRFDDSGTNLGTAWREPTFDDGAWSVGNAEFGFGEGDEATPLTPGAITYYARTDFEFSGANPASLALRLKADDGAVVYLNGTEIVRDNLPDGHISASTPASGWKGGADEDFVDYLVPSDALVQGGNLLAVEVHNVWTNNADLSLDVALSMSDLAPPDGGDGPLVAKSARWHYIDDAVNTPANWTGGIVGPPEEPAPLGFGENFIASTVETGNEAYYFTHSFDVDDADQFDDLTLSLRADDGAVVYLNGTEVHRFNMPAGPVGWATRPITWVAGPAEVDYIDTVIPGDQLVDGGNVIAVEVHNFWPGNADLSFDLSLDGIG